MQRMLTIGHSNHSADEFLRRLTSHQVTAVADVRARPVSRRNPHFYKRNLELLLSAAGVGYRHFPSLGGHRVPDADSVNGGWRNDAFRGYADYMQSRDFEDGLEALLGFARKSVVAVMCAESQWKDCHRQLIADALIVRAVEVRHIMSGGDLIAHQLTPFARITGTVIEYPALF
jgi:uncharacterized protein (DUF488 family)